MATTAAASADAGYEKDKEAQEQEEQHSPSSSSSSDSDSSSSSSDSDSSDSDDDEKNPDGKKRALSGGRDEGGKKKARVLCFRNYRPKTESLQKAVIAPANVLDDVQWVDSEVKEIVEKARVSQGWLLNIVPKKVNWDLKRDVATRMEVLKQRTQRAIVELVRDKITEERIKQGQQQKESSSSSSSSDDDSSSSSSESDNENEN